MSPRHLVALLALVCVPLVSAGEDPPAAIKGADLELLGTVRAIAERVEALRQEKFVRPPVAVRTPDHMREVSAEIRALAVVRRDRLAARGRAWSDLGLGALSGPESLYLTLAGDLAGIGFDPEGNRLLVAPDRLTDSDFAPRKGEDDAPATVLLMTGVRVDEPVVSHLLVHVRQRERAGGDWLAETTDRLIARSAWAEGEANLVAIRYLFGGMGLADDVLEQSLDPGDVLDGALLPPGLAALAPPVEALVRFVYEDGFAAAARAYREGGWEALGRAMTRPTTRDVIHPGRQALADPPPSAEPPAAARGLALRDEDTLGEQGVVVLVSTVAGKDSLALQAGDGWVADRLYRFEPQDAAATGGVTLWVTHWATDDDAADFEYAVERMLEARFPGRPPVTLPSGERVVQTPDRIVRSSRAGRELRLQIATRDLDSLPAGALTDAP